jgi:hypothetical protein
MNIPEHLAHLRVDRRGRPVPYIQLWTGEGTAAEWVIRDDPMVEGPAVFTRGQPGRGTPDFFHQAPQRQRRCMIERRCQICEDRVPADDALLLIGSVSGRRVDVEDFGQVVCFTEPWLCPACAFFALTHCPGLIRRRRAEELMLIRPVASVVLIRDYMWIEGRLERYSKARKPVMWVKVACPAFENVCKVPEVVG